MKKLKCSIFIDADIIVRHFLDSNIFKDLIEKHDVKFVFPQKSHKRINSLDFEKLEKKYDLEYINQDSKRLSIWRRLLFIDQMRLRFGYQNKSIRYLRQQTNSWKFVIISFLLGLPIIWSIYSKIQKNRLLRNSNKEILNHFQKFKPDIIIHPSVLEGIFINDLIILKKNLKIPLIVIMNSWDNPSTKKAVIGKPDYLFVWGKQTYLHAIKYMKMKPEKVIKFGAAQFDIFSNKIYLKHEAFRALYKLRKDQVVILYAGSSKSTNEIEHLSILDKAIKNKCLKNVKIIYRPHPWGGGGKGGKNLLNKKWKNIIIDKTMLKYLEYIKKGGNKKFLSDYNDTHLMLSNVDAVISPLSTILIEATILGKPTLCFLPFSDNSNHFQIDVKLIHFHEFFQNDNFLKAYGYNELIPKVNELLSKTKNYNISKKLKNESDYYVKKFNQSYSKRILNFVEKSV